MIPHDILLDYIKRFFGYGSLRARYWFVGLEEGGADHLAERRLNLWERAQRPPTVGLRSTLGALEGIDWFGPKAPLQ